MNLSRYLHSRRRLLEKTLSKYLPKSNKTPIDIHRAMRYAVFTPGKRLRPILAIAACEACGGEIKDILPCACAIELVHTYSLVHDDLPSMDNDAFRRGRPTCHKKFGEALAILAGDALLSLAFQITSQGSNSDRNIEIINTLSTAIGTSGMVGGQVMDIEAKDLDLRRLEYINLHKTAALIAASLKIGAIAAGTNRPKAQRLFKFGKYLGLAYQIIDDLIDREGYYLLLGEKTRKEAQRFIEKANMQLRPFGRKADMLRSIAEYVLMRNK